MRDNIITSIDLGSSLVRCVIADASSEVDGQIRILGVGAVESDGMRRGAVVDIVDAAEAISVAVEKAEMMSNVQVKSAIVSIGGAGLTIESTKGVVAIGRADGEVTEDDVTRVINAAQSIVVPANKEIIHVIPRSFRLDDQKDINDPIGLQGVRLEVDAVVVEAPGNHVKNLTHAMERADITVEDFIIEPLAAAESVLTKKQKELGVVLVNLGASTTSLAVFEEGELVYTAIVPIGSDFITNDIAIGLRTSIDTAERVKFEYGSAILDQASQRSKIDLSQIDPREDGEIPHSHVIEIIEARLEEIFELVQKELRSIGKDQLLPAGAILTGGGVNLPRVAEFAKRKLRLPVQIGRPENLLGVMDKVDDSSYATVVGLILWAMDDIHYSGGRNKFTSGILGAVSGGAKSSVKNVGSWLGKFLP
ncbi:MAG: cell division protein FtsA [Candidatus Moranbacteria bacterium]|nr:cell division protein FtsA [Candidatus Moranbacteria bacterium]